MSRARKQPQELRSYRWFGKDDLRSFGHRSRAKQAGFSLDEVVANARKTYETMTGIEAIWLSQLSSLWVWRGV